MTEPKCIVGLKKSQKGIIAEVIYNESMRKLMSMGVLPVLLLKLLLILLMFLKLDTLKLQLIKRLPLQYWLMTIK